jgi:transposase-like protein
LDEPARTLKWKELSGEERYRVVEMARKGEVSLSELCRTFGVSRQTLYRAMEAADQASTEALEPKKRGRKPRPPSEAQRAELENSNAELHKELEHWKAKYQVARALLDLERKMDRGEPLPGEKGKKKKRRKKGKAPSGRRPRRAAQRMASSGDGRGDGDHGPGSESVD